MPSYDSTLEDIKDRLDIVDFIAEYVNLKKAGQNWKGLCPFHAEKTPSFTVSPAKQIFHCFGCGSGGDIFTFLTRHESLSFPEALKVLAERAGITLKASHGSPAKTGEKEKLLSIHKDAAAFFSQQLPKHTAASAYLKKRGIDAEVQKQFSLGYAPKSWNALLSFLERKGHKGEILKKGGLVTQGRKGRYDTFRDRIMFPIFDLQGDIIAFGGRSIDGSEPKYLNSPETPIFNKRRIIYGLNFARDAIKATGFAIFMEGYLDVITAHLQGFTNAIAPLGTAISPEHGKLLKRFTENVMLAFDSDAAGIKAARSASNILFESDLNVKILPIPDNDDPDSFLRKRGKKEFEKLLGQPLTIIDFFLKHGKDRRVTSREVLETISKVPDKVLQGDYIKLLAEKLNVEEKYVREEFQRMKNRPQRGYQKPHAGTGTRPRPKRKPLDEVYIIQLLLQLPEKVKDVCSILSVEDFEDMTTRNIFKQMKDGAKDLNALLSKSEGEEKSFLTKISVEDAFEDPEKVLGDCIKRLGDKKRKVMIKELDRKIKDAESKKDAGLLTTLLTERNNIIKSQALK
jgi:DNA primase